MHDVILRSSAALSISGARSVNLVDVGPGGIRQHALSANFRSPRGLQSQSIPCCHSPSIGHTLSRSFPLESLLGHSITTLTRTSVISFDKAMENSSPVGSHSLHTRLCGACSPRLSDTGPC